MQDKCKNCSIYYISEIMVWIDQINNGIKYDGIISFILLFSSLLFISFPYNTFITAYCIQLLFLKHLYFQDKLLFFTVQLSIFLPLYSLLLAIFIASR